MLYVHYCITCDKIHILNGHKKICPACGKKLHELKLTFLQYSTLDDTDRQNCLRGFMTGFPAELILRKCDNQKNKRRAEHLLVTEQVVTHIGYNAARST